MSTADACVFGAAPNAVGAPEKIFAAVESCACVSSPITTSQLTGLPSGLRTSGSIRAWGGPARSHDYPPRYALRGRFALGAALRAHTTTLRATRFGVDSRLGRPCALMRG